ncbi:hypothetical protein SPBR_05334 [Sporothrix brasiliensis 5110]|uniref:Uncharacterized protein n=1 Tax=Sporothrix brasiliensis 5110 TaxID=1398154 RepID=A0A0C2F8G0_9PEZI|nr:uncharacterized protein SPBR_05334 [Sporothrix brasiliensis 5110]KIH87343.1 hypothetical protein SPBR_05334 [Sporothrix brasiliensis 5110]
MPAGPPTQGRPRRVSINVKATPGQPLNPIVLAAAAAAAATASNARAVSDDNTSPSPSTSSRMSSGSATPPGRSSLSSGTLSLEASPARSSPKSPVEDTAPKTSATTVPDAQAMGPLKTKAKEAPGTPTKAAAQPSGVPAAPAKPSTSPQGTPKTTSATPVKMPVTMPVLPGRPDCSSRPKA